MLSEGKNLDESLLKSKMCENADRKYRDISYCAKTQPVCFLSVRWLLW